MKPLVQFGLFCLLAPGLFAWQHAGVGAAHAQHSRYGYGGYYEPFYDYGYWPAADGGEANVTVVYPPPTPVVAIAQTAHPVIHEYAQPEDYRTPPEGPSRPILYLIAFRDSSIRAAMAYWVEAGALHYLDTGHHLKQAPLSSVDRDLSAQLNRERRIPFDLR
ncbi:MAG: hypothetical protein ABSH24_00785 [Bryobacteraceae bacterium]|jgi:hypothetical protein